MYLPKTTKKMENKIKEMEEYLIESCKKKISVEGFYAGNEKYWLKCDSLEIAQKTGMRYVFFVSKQFQTTLYQC